MDRYASLNKLFIVLILNFCIFVILPGLIANRNFPEKKPDTSSETYSQWRIKHALQRDTLKNKTILEILELDSLKTNLSSDKTRLKALEEKYQNIKVSILPFNNTPTLFLWWLTLSALFYLFYLYGGDNKQIFANYRQYKAYLIFVLFYPPFLLRNVIAGTYEKGRRVWAYNNHDIDGASHLFQALTMLYFSWLVYAVIQAALREKKQEQADEPDSLGKGEDPVIVSYLQISKETYDLYQKWVVNSIILAIAFLYWTFIYWDFVLHKGDKRYVISALSIHLIWAVTWYAISVNLIENLGKINRSKYDLIRRFAQNPSEHERVHNMVMAHNPLNHITWIMTLLGAAIALLSPLFKSFVPQ